MILPGACEISHMFQATVAKSLEYMFPGCSYAEQSAGPLPYDWKERVELLAMFIPP